MSELLTDEELAPYRNLVTRGGGLNRLEAGALLAHIDALTAQRDAARKDVDFALGTAQIQRRTIDALTAQRDRARDWAIQLEQELNAAGGHAHANQQATEGEA